jgi:hypothetical protein
MKIGMNLRGFVCIVILEKWLGFEDDEVVHRVLEFFEFVICDFWKEKLRKCLCELANSEWICDD